MGFVEEILHDAPAVWFRLGESSGGTAIDAVGGAAGAYVGRCSLGVPGLIASDPDDAVGFDGVESHVAVAGRAELDLGDRFTIEAWIRFAADARREFAAVVDKGAGAYILRTDEHGRLLLRRNGVADVVTSTVALAAERTYHVVATKDGPDARLYLDGIDVSGSVANVTMADSELPLMVGTDDSLDWFGGTIDELALYPVALSPVRVRAHFEAASGRMTITRVQHATAAQPAFERALAVALSAPAEAGSVLVSGVAVNKSAGETPAPSPGWTLVGGDAAGSVSIAMAYRIADGGSGDVCDWSWPNHQIAAAWIAEYDGFDAGLSMPVPTVAAYSDDGAVTAVDLGSIAVPEHTALVAMVGVDTLPNWGGDAAWTGLARVGRSVTTDGGFDDVGCSFADLITTSADTHAVRATAVGGSGDQASALAVLLIAGERDPLTTVRYDATRTPDQDPLDDPRWGVWRVRVEGGALRAGADGEWSDATWLAPPLGGRAAAWAELAEDMTTASRSLVVGVGSVKFTAWGTEWFDLADGKTWLVGGEPGERGGALRAGDAVGIVIDGLLARAWIRRGAGTWQSVLQAPLATPASGEAWIALEGSTAVSRFGCGDLLPSTSAVAAPPSTPVLDTAARPDGDPPPGPGWGEDALLLDSYTMGIRSSAIQGWAEGSCSAYWATPFANDQEVYATIATIDCYARLYLGVVGPGTDRASGYVLQAPWYGQGMWRLQELVGGVAVDRVIASASGQPAAGDRLLLRRVGSTITGLWHSRGSWTEVIALRGVPPVAASCIGIGADWNIAGFRAFGGGQIALSPGTHAVVFDGTGTVDGLVYVNAGGRAVPAAGIGVA